MELIRCHVSEGNAKKKNQTQNGRRRESVSLLSLSLGKDDGRRLQPPGEGRFLSLSLSVFVSERERDRQTEDSHDAGNSCLDLAHEWPSDDSDDDDYNPEVNVKNHITLTNSGENRDDDVDDVGFSSSESFCSSDDANMEFRGQSTDGNECYFSLFMITPRNHLDFYEADDQDALCFRRQKRDVDYKKLYDVSF